MLKPEQKARKDDNRKKAVALRYRVAEDAAPVVIASGYGQIADKIITVAEEKGIPVFKDDSTASMLCMLEVGRNIPQELYQVIAAVYMQVLAFSGKIKQQPAGQGGALGATGKNSVAEDLRRQLNSLSPNTSKD